MVNLFRCLKHNQFYSIFHNCHEPSMKNDGIRFVIGILVFKI